jgi:selenide,water dikinase
MTQASEVSAEIFAASVPTLEEAWEYVRKGKIPAATHTNLQYVNPYIRFENELNREMSLMLADPQTAGGLLIAVPAGRTEQLIGRLRELKTPAASRIGRIIEEQDKRILVYP